MRPYARAVVALLPLAAATCYYPDGTSANDVACTDDTDESACCGSGYACYGTSSQYFLCQATGDELKKNGATELVRGSCTDKTWRSGSCPSVCVSEDRDNLSGGNGVGQCINSTTEFYCISSGLGVENCTTGYQIIDFARTPSAVTTIGVAVSTSSVSATVPPTSATSSPAETTAAGGSSGLSSGAKAGIGIGVSLGTVAVAGIAGFLFWLRRRKSKQDVTANTASLGPYGSPSLAGPLATSPQPYYDNPYSPYGAPKPETNTSPSPPTVVSELPPSIQRHELA